MGTVTAIETGVTRKSGGKAGEPPFGRPPASQSLSGRHLTSGQPLSFGSM